MFSAHHLALALLMPVSALSWSRHVRAQDLSSRPDAADSTPPGAHPVAPNAQRNPPNGVGAAYPAIARRRANDDEHMHEGFYLGAQIGAGYSRASAQSSGNDLRIQGPGATLLVSIGRSVVRNLVIHGDFVGSYISGPIIRLNGSEQKFPDMQLYLPGFGAGLTYYFMPVNIYVGASVLASYLSLEDKTEDLRYESSFGVGGLFKLGKQFWLSRHVGLDVGPVFHLTRLPSKGSDPTLTGWAFSVLAGVSYN